MRLSECQKQRRECVWFSSLSSEYMAVALDWCVNCGASAEPGPHILVKGKRRKVEDVQPPEGIL